MKLHLSNYETPLIKRITRTPLLTTAIICAFLVNLQRPRVDDCYIVCVVYILYEIVSNHLPFDSASMESLRCRYAVEATIIGENNRLAYQRILGLFFEAQISKSEFDFAMEKLLPEMSRI